MLKKLLSLSLATAMCIAGTASTCVTAATDIMSVDEENTAYTVGMNGITSNISDEVNDDPVEQLRRLYPDDCTNIIILYNTPLRFAFTEYSNIDDVLTGKELLAKYYAVEHNDGSFTFFNEDLKELKSNSYTEIDGKTVELPFINMPEGAVNAYKNSDFAKECISPDAVIESVYYLSGENSMMGTAVYYKTSVGDYVYYYYHTIGEMLFPLDDFCDFQQAISDEYAKNPDADGGIDIADVWDLSDYMLRDVNDDPVEQLRSLYPDDCTNIISVYNTPLRFAFTEYSNIDGVLTGKELLAKYYAVEHKDGSFTFFNEDLKELKSNSYTEIDGKTVELPFINMPEGAVNAYKNSDFAKKYISPDAEIVSVYYLSSESSMMGTAVYYKTSVGDYVYFVHYDIGSALFPITDFCKYQQAINDEISKHPDLDAGDLNIAGIWDLSEYELQAITSGIMGDVNNDGAFNISDVVLLQKWLLAVPDTHLANWKAADYCEDNKLNVFDLCLMKRALIEKMNDEPQNVDISFKFNSVTDIRYNDDNHTKWTGFVARSENDLINILAENEGVSADKASIEGIDSNTFKDKSIVIVYSICTAGNSYSIIDNISVKGTSIDVSTISKKPMVPTPDMLFRRYVYVIDKNAVTNADSFNFTDESSYYQYDEENEAVAWFKEWCQAQ